MTHLSPLRYKAVGFLEFEADSPIHIGIGGFEARRGFLKLPGGELLIPSSTWKGAFRSISEKIARSSQYNGLEKLAVELYRESMGGIRYRGDGEERKAFNHFLEQFINRLRGCESDLIKDEPGAIKKALGDLGYGPEEIREVVERGKAARDGLAYDMAENYIALHCPIGRLYGNRVLAGKMRFGDSVILHGAIHVRPGIGISRGRLKAEPHRLFFIETVVNAKLRLPIIIDNAIPGESDSILLARTLKWIRELGLSIGGRKSAGLGSLKLANNGGEFYLIKLGQNLAIGNPFKKAEKFELERLTSWLEDRE